MLEFEPPSLEMGNVQNVVDDGDQRIARVSNDFGALALVGVEVRVEQQVRHGDHAVHRRAQLVAHHGQELVLEPLDLALARHVARQPAVSQDLPVGTPDRECEHHQVARLIAAELQVERKGRARQRGVPRGFRLPSGLVGMRRPGVEVVLDLPERMANRFGPGTHFSSSMRGFKNITRSDGSRIISPSVIWIAAASYSASVSVSWINSAVRCWSAAVLRNSST